MARRGAGPDLVGGGQAVLAGEVDVDDGDVWLGCLDGGEHVVAGGNLGHDFEVVFEAEKGSQGATDHVHVLGWQDFDHDRRPPDVANSDSE